MKPCCAMFCPSPPICGPAAKAVPATPKTRSSAMDATPVKFLSFMESSLGSIVLFGTTTDVLHTLWTTRLNLRLDLHENRLTRPLLGLEREDEFERGASSYLATDVNSASVSEDNRPDDG